MVVAATISTGVSRGPSGSVERREVSVRSDRYDSARYSNRPVPPQILVTGVVYESVLCTGR